MPKNIERTARLLIDALTEGRKVLVCGNGGSAADAQHMAGELVGSHITIIHVLCELVEEAMFGD